MLLPLPSILPAPTASCVAAASRRRGTLLRRTLLLLLSLLVVPSLLAMPRLPRLLGWKAATSVSRPARGSQSAGVRTVLDSAGALCGREEWATGLGWGKRYWAAQRKGRHERASAGRQEGGAGAGCRKQGATAHSCTTEESPQACYSELWKTRAALA